MNYCYFDWISAAPVLPEVIQAMQMSLQRDFANPSSRLHPFGIQSQRSLNAARDQIAQLISAYDPIEIIFTASTTEANNTAIYGIAKNSERGKHLLISSIEHPSIKKAAERLKWEGFEIEEIPVNEFGVVELDYLKDAIRDDTALVAVQLANTEIGTIQPIAKVGEICKEKGVPLHSDGWGYVGILPLKIAELNITSLAFGANGFYGPIGAAALWIDKSIELLPFIVGGAQEQKRRAGTENLSAIVGMAEAAKIAIKEGFTRVDQLKQRTNLIKRKLQLEFHEPYAPFIHETGDPENRLPQLYSFRLDWIEGEALLLELGYHSVAAMSGTACVQPELGASYVLENCGVPKEQLNGGVTLSVGWSTTEEEIEYGVSTLSRVVKRLFSMSPVISDPFHSETIHEK
ncbi:MAG: cysteine desulfurase [bacterium]|nr:cysteine desulfurase [bacterium]